MEEESALFMGWSVNNSNKPHVVAAAFALGSEHIIPEMFRALLDKMNISREEAGVIHYYLDRHIELDGDLHGPISMRMLELLCEEDKTKIAGAEEAALHAIKVRIKFWDGVLLAIESKKTVSSIKRKDRQLPRVLFSTLEAWV